MPKWNSINCGIEINNLSDFAKIVDSLKTGEKLIYRGQREDWPLLPGLARVRPRSSVLEDELLMLEEFSKEAKALVNHPPTNPWDSLALAQHYGLPTRLLDWTKDPSTALYFAVCEPSIDRSRPGVVWIFKPEERDIVDDVSKGRPFAGTRVKIFESTYSFDRMKAQQGLFTVHKYIEKLTGFRPLNEDKRHKTRLCKIFIPAHAFPKLRRDLHEHEVNAFTLLPDLIGLCMRIKWQYTLSQDE